MVYNGVDSDHFELTGSFEAGKRLRASLGVKPESLLIGTVGMCRPEKNQDVLLTTPASPARGARRCAPGDCRRRSAARKLKRRAAELEIARSRALHRRGDDVRPVLAALDVFVLPSIAVESFSNAALEAMSMGRPVILSDIGGAREMINDGVEGYVVSPTELAARLPAIIAALYSDRRKRQQMGAAARSRAVNCFSVPAMVAGYRGLLHDGERAMNADLLDGRHATSSQPGATRAATDPTGACGCCSSAPVSAVRGGISSVEQLICDYLPPYVSHPARVRPWRRARLHHQGRGVRARRAGAAARAGIAGSGHRAHPLRVARQHAAQDDPRRRWWRAPAGRWCCTRTARRFDQFHRGLPAALRRNVNRTPAARQRVHHAVAAQWRDFFVDDCELSPSQVTVLPNPVRWSRRAAESRRAHAACSSWRSDGSRERKGSYDLVKAFAALPADLRARARLVLAGDGDVEGVRQLAAPLGDAVRGACPGSTARERDRLLADSDVFVLPSRAEGMPMALLEAMAAGLPAIVTPVGGIPDVFTHGCRRRCWWHRAASTELRAAMARLLTDETERLAAGRRAHARARAFDVHVYARRLAEHLPAHRAGGRTSGTWHERGRLVRRLLQEAGARPESHQAQSLLLRPCLRRMLDEVRESRPRRPARLGERAAGAVPCAAARAPSTGESVRGGDTLARAGRCSRRNCCATGCRPSPRATTGSRRRPPPAVPAACR